MEPELGPRWTSPRKCAFRIRAMSHPGATNTIPQCSAVHPCRVSVWICASFNGFVFMASRYGNGTPNFNRGSAVASLRAYKVEFLPAIAGDLEEAAAAADPVAGDSDRSPG